MSKFVNPSTYTFDPSRMKYVACGECNGKGRVRPDVVIDKRKVGDNRTYDEMAAPVKCKKCMGRGFVVIVGEAR